MKSLYLSGPITGCTYEGCTSWRQYVAQRLAHDIVPVSPLRGKEYLKTMPAMPHTLETHVMSSQRGIMTRDRYDTMACDGLFANLLGVTWAELDKAAAEGDVRRVRASLGTVMEVAWADMLRKPIILVMEAEDNIHDHPMIRDAAGYRVETLDEGIALANALLSYDFARDHQ